MEYTGYLFVHFIGEEEDGEQVYFALSRDGLHWQDLNGGKPMLRSHIGECGVRDPFIIRSPWPAGEAEKKSKYYLMATDLRIGAGKGWEAAQYDGSRDIIVWESEDLVNWQGPRACEVGLREAGCVWAPEAVYDREKDAFMVFFASMVKLPGEEAAKQRIYAVYTRDFRTFTEPQLYLESERHVIDTTIVETAEGYYRYSKDETTARIRVEFGESLHKDAFHRVSSPVLDELCGVEGPEIFRLNDSGKWCLVVDRFAAGKGYLPLVAEKLSDGNFTIPDESEFDMGVLKKRHGGIMNLTEEEYGRLEKLL
ncbi:MAG: glycoside hydrolase family 43 protein [Lachnospiraceae bacterium]|nr:glycoside hydrolase family 43 protein [Lachnospiraceae bacterium]